MNKKELIRRALQTLKDNEVRKPVNFPRHSFTITDNEGNSKEFIVKKSDKDVAYTIQDVGAILDAVIFNIEESIKRGEEVALHGFGAFGIKYRLARSTISPQGNRVEVPGRYVTKFYPGTDLRTAVKLYELSLTDITFPDDPLPEIEDEDTAQSDDEDIEEQIVFDGKFNARSNEEED